MTINNASYTNRTSFQWIRSDSGETYICPADAIKGKKDLSDAELQELCVNESLNPHNN